METTIYSTIYSDDLNSIEEGLKKVLKKGSFKRIEQGTVLLYDDDDKIELSVEPHKNSFYLSGRIKKDLTNCQTTIDHIGSVLKDAGIKFSLDYQEENEDGELTIHEFNISN